MKQKIFTLFLVLFSLMGIGSRVEAATITAAATGNWSATATWNGNVVPTYADSVVIPSGFTVTIDAANSSCQGINVQDGGTLTMGAASDLYVCNITIGTNGTFNSATASNASPYSRSIYLGVLYISGTKTPQTGSYFINNDGQFGGTATGTNDGISIFFSDKATSITMQGSASKTGGTVYMARIMAQAFADNTSDTNFDFNIKQNIVVNNNSTTGIYFSLQNNKAHKVGTTRTCTIFPGYTLKFATAGRFHANAGAPAANSGNFIYNIYGTLDLATNNGALELWCSSASGNTQSVTINVGNGTDYAQLKLGRTIRLNRYYSGQSITLNVNNPHSKIVLSGNGSYTLASQSANGVEDFRNFPATIRNLSYENSVSSGGYVLPIKTTITDTLYLPGTGGKLYAGNTVSATAATVSLGKLFSYNNQAYIVTTVGTPATVTSTTIPAWVSGTTVTDASGNSYYCDPTGLTVGTLSFLGGTYTLGNELTNCPVNVTGNVVSTISGSGNWARITPYASVSGNIDNNSTGNLYFGKGTTVGGSFTNNGILTNASGAAIATTGAFTNNGTVSLSSGLTTGDLTNNSTIALGTSQLTLNGSLSGTGTIDASTGYIVYNGTSTQTLAASNLTSSVNGLTVKPGSKLTTSGSITATTINLQCNSASGAATLINTGTMTNTTANVQQYLTGSGATTPNTRFWYFTSPLTDATSNAFDVTSTNPVNKLWLFSESAYGYTPITDLATTLTKGMGYVARLGANKTVTFAGTTLNNGDINIPITRTGTELAKRGYNLVGNPYPSYLDINAVFNDLNTTGVESTIWYRSYNSTNNIMAYDTYNAASGAGISLGSGGTALNNNIPPMQAFWVRAAADGVNGNLALTNAMRSHQASGNKLRSTTADTLCFEKIRLEITNGRGKDQAFIGMYPQARDSFERFDSHKMFNEVDSIPEIFTFAGKDEVAINGLAPFGDRKDLKLGFRSRIAGHFTIKALELGNLDANTRVILKDKLLNITQDLTETPTYSFVSDAASTTDRFTLTIVKTATALASYTNDIFDVRSSDKGSVEIALQGCTQASVKVFDMTGKKIHEQSLNNHTAALSKAFDRGMYLVQVTGNGKECTKKVLVNP
jgi:hypothetical protein